MSAQVQWLLMLSGAACTLPEEEAHPQVLCNIIMADSRAAGFSEQHMSSSDLEAGWGMAVIVVLLSLADLALKAQQSSWKQPLRHPEM